MIEVRDINNNVRCEVPITDKCVYQKTLMTEEYVLLSFVSDTLIPFAKGDSIKTDFGKFYLKDIEKPTRANDGGWQYEQKFVAKWELLRNHILFYNRQLGFEKSWKMTQRPEYFMDIVVRNIQLAGYGRYSYEVDASLTEMKLVEFDATNIIDALAKIAEAWETEWWIDGTVIHIGKCEFGSAVMLTDGDEVTSLEREDSQDTSYCTRAYVFGSTRNLPKNYRKNDDGSVVVEGVVETRLKLPAGTPYIDAWDNLKDDEVIEGVIVLDDVYPRRTGTISTITTKQYTDEIENEDGSKTYQKWNAFRFTDTGLKFSKDYIIAGEELRIVFQTGKLAGMDFAVNFNPDGLAEAETAAQVFEIVRNEDYGVALPTDDFKPSVGDTYILYGYDTKFVYDNLVSEAEQELLQKGREKLADLSKDKSVYNCNANPVRCAGYKPNSTGNLIHTTADEIDLDVGQSVLLKSENIDRGSRSSRVRGFEKHLDNKYNCSYVIGEDSAYSRGDDLQAQVDELTYQSKQFVNVYGNSIYVVKRYDITAPSDNNVPSFRRAQYEFLQKHVADRANKKIGFDEGIELGNFVTHEQGGRIDGRGNAELLSLIVRSFLSSPDFATGFDGNGWKLWLEDNLSHLEIDRLTVRQIMSVFELIIARIRAVGGQIVVSAANGKVKSVEDTGEAYKLTFEGDNYFQPHDLMRCQVFKGNAARGYWVEVSSADTTSVTVPKSEFADWGTEPKEGDEVVLMGNTENALRQNCIVISATEAKDGEPCIDVLDGVKSKSFADCLRARLGNLDGITDTWFPADKQPHGNGLYSDNAYLRGTFLLSTGEDVKTKFEITEGRITSSLEALRQDFMADKGFLSNPTFGDGMSHWTATNATIFFFLGQKWIWANDNVLVRKGDGASLYVDDYRNVVRIKNSAITQKFADLRGVPEIKTNADGKKEAAAVYLSFFYKVKKKGTLTIGFENIDNTGFAEYEPLSYKAELDTTETYQQLTLSGLWNATGDFKLAFTGDIFVYMFVLSTDRVETLTNTYKTLFEQSERLVKISAAVFDKDGNALKETGLMIKAEGAGIYAQTADGNIALIGATVTDEQDGTQKTLIKLTGDEIRLEGSVTANGYFKILEDGSIEAVNGKFTGEIDATKGTIGGFTISSDHIGAKIEDSKTATYGNLAIYKDLFRVGGSHGYVLFGNDVIPAIAGGAFTAVGRIVNDHPNTNGDFGLDQANYGLFIDVTGGTKNYGIQSNAALLAPAFVNTKAKLLTFSPTSGNYEVDFSQNNIILLYYNKEGSGGAEVTLPDESSVAYKFGYTTLPDDFATVVTFRVRTGSQKIVLKDIYNHNEDKTNYTLQAGDSIQVLVSKADGFRYQILNHSS